MRKVLTIVVAALMVSAVVGAAQAAENNWRIGLTADNGAGMGSSGTNHIGVTPTASDGADGADLEAAYGADIGQTTIWPVGVISTTTYTRDLKAGDLALPKVWDLRVAALPQSTYTQIRLNFVQISPTVNPPGSVGGESVEYMLEMINNRGVAGAPANGTVWDVSAITGGDHTVPGLLPILKLPVGTHSAMIDYGYVLQFRQQVVPEPSSLLALGSGLTGLLGFIVRRRRA